MDASKFLVKFCIIEIQMFSAKNNLLLVFFSGFSAIFVSTHIVIRVWTYAGFLFYRQGHTWWVSCLKELTLGVFLLVSFWFFGGTGVWIQGLVLARQMLYHTPALFCFSYISNRVSHLYLGWPGLQCSYLHFPNTWDGPAFYWLRWGLTNCLPGLALKCHLPNAHHLSS
jgi:hypothetical protein